MAGSERARRRWRRSEGGMSSWVVEGGSSEFGVSLVGRSGSPRRFRRARSLRDSSSSRRRRDSSAKRRFFSSRAALRVASSSSSLRF